MSGWTFTRQAPVASVREDSGRVIARSVLPTEGSALTKLVRGLRELEVLRALRPPAKAARVAEAKRDPAWPVLRAIPFLGPVRVALLLATMQTPWRFRTKRHLWAYAGLAVVTRSTADYTLVRGRPVRRRRPPMTRGLNRNPDRILKEGFQGAATAASARPGPLQDFYQGMLARGMRPELARVTLTSS